MANPDLEPGALAKPIRGAALLKRRDTRKALVKAEDAQKAIVRRRDVSCRYPHCPYCRSYKDLPLDVAHVVQAKGMSGDRTLERSTPDRMMLLCRPIHGEQEQDLVEIRPLTTEGTDGACEFWRYNRQERSWYLVAREIAVGRYERD